MILAPRTEGLFALHYLYYLLDDHAYFIKPGSHLIAARRPFDSHERGPPNSLDTGTARLSRSLPCEPRE